MKCPYCGTWNSEDANTCSQCGRGFGYWEKVVTMRFGEGYWQRNLALGIISFFIIVPIFIGIFGYIFNHMMVNDSIILIMIGMTSLLLILVFRDRFMRIFHLGKYDERYCK